jgi:hypothetical protein
VIHLQTQWRAGHAFFVISLTTLIPMAVGWIWIRLLRGLSGLRPGRVDDQRRGHTATGGGSN